MSSMLQERLEEFGLTVLNYINDQIHIDYFYSEIRYEDFLNGSNCRQGMGLYDTNENLQFNKLSDGKVVIVQHDGIEIARYKYKTIFKATFEYKQKNPKTNIMKKKSLTFSLRKNEFGKDINYFTKITKEKDFDDDPNLTEKNNNKTKFEDDKRNLQIIFEEDPNKTKTIIVSLDFPNLKEFKKYLNEEYGNYQIKEWSVYIE